MFNKLWVRYSFFLSLFICLSIGMMSLILLYQNRSLSNTHTKITSDIVTRGMEDQVVRQGENISNLLAENLIAPVYFNNINKIYAYLHSALKQRNIKYIYIYDADDLIIHDGVEEIPSLGRPVSSETFVSINHDRDILPHAVQGETLEVSTPLYLADEYLGGIIIGLELRTINQKIDEVQAALRQSEQKIIRSAFFSFGLSTLILLIIGIVIAAGLAGRLTKPVRQLADWSQKISQGEYYEMAIEYTALDELGQLVHSFKNMSREVQNHRDDLENQVRERTEKLSLANMQLKQKIDESKQLQSERLQLQKQLHQAQKMEAIGLMAGAVAHDLNNILSGVVTYPSMLLMQLPQDSEMRKPIETIQDSGKRAAQVVADLLTVAQGAGGIRQVSNINVLIEEYLASPEWYYTRSKYPEITITTEFDPQLPNTLCSPVHIKKCLMNLMNNAAEAIEGAGTINFSTSNQYVDNPVYNDLVLQDGWYVVLNVTDSGPGIPENDLQRIFEPFYSKKVLGKSRSGTGLGLTVVWNTVLNHGGAVTVESGGQGTTFTLYFPATRQEIDFELSDIGVKELRGDGEHILIVDDEPQQRQIATDLLKTFGYRVDSVDSGEKAVAYLQENKIDLLLLDMIMDPGISGRETYEQILRLHPGQKAIIASGYSENEEVKKTMGLGASEFVKKPYVINQLALSVKYALHG